MDVWGVRKTIGAVGVAVAVAGVGGAAISAATGGGHSTMEHGMQGAFGPPPGGFSPGHADEGSDTVHGEYVVADGAGGFVTRITQNGKVTAISPASVTVRSDDGFVATYVVSGRAGAGGEPFVVGDEAIVEARREGKAAVVSTMRPPLSSGRFSGR